MPTDLYSRLRERKEYESPDLRDCIENTVQKLLDNDTNLNKPGMLLGKIQSGKTRAFIGVIALAFDQGYDLTIILTKGTKALAQQTYQRMKKEFAFFIDQVQFFDIMLNFPGNLTRYELNQKIILVVKKQKDNLTKLHKAIFETYPELANKRVLIVDDEADYSSIGFSKNKNERVEIRTIAGQIDGLRRKLRACDFLQVTATPYSLYLQPEDLTIGTSETFMPVKPAFTTLTPVPSSYVGGNYYFNQQEEEETPANHLYTEVPADELRILRKPDRRSFKIEEALVSNRIAFLRQAVVNFVVGGCIRRLQDRSRGEAEGKFSFIVHTEQNKAAHEWQEEIVREISDQLTKAAAEGTPIFHGLVKSAYENLSKSVQLMDTVLPAFGSILEETQIALKEEYLVVNRVNSDKDVNELLDDTGQLKLRTPLNIYIGGQILDRGITVGNLIGFYYGRSPKTYQQDTVLQHSRMFGHRPIEDLTVTRFYTTRDIYESMRRMEEFDSALRSAFESGVHDQGVVFIQRDEKNRIIPCSPNKLLLSSTTTLKPGQRRLPFGFQTGCKTNISKIVKELDEIIHSCMPKNPMVEAFLINLDTAVKIIDKIEMTLEFEEGYSWDARAFISSMEYLSIQSPNQAERGKVWAVVREGRDALRIREGGRFEDSPDTGRQKVGERRIAREAAVDTPALILLRQNGKEEHYWRGTSFWWPVLVTPKNMRAMVFASKSVELE